MLGWLKGNKNKEQTSADVTIQEAPPFFVTGQPKSGTGWLMKLLDAHPEVMCRGEGRFFERDRRMDVLKDHSPGTPGGRMVQPSSLYNALAESEYLRMWVSRSVWTKAEPADEHLAELTGLAVRHFLSKKLEKTNRARGTNKRLVGDKTPLGDTGTVREIGTILPESKVIHIIRDGRDQAVSFQHHVWRGGVDRGGVHELSPEEIVRRDTFYGDRQRTSASGRGIFEPERLAEFAAGWKRNVEAARREGRALPEEKYVEVTYEALQADPEREAARLFGFLGVAADAETIQRCVEAASFEKLAGRKPGGEDYALDFKKQRKGIAGDWQNVFNEEDRCVFKQEAGNLLIELGYERDDDW